jgi:hypothetical protein
MILIAAAASRSTWTLMLGISPRRSNALSRKIATGGNHDERRFGQFALKVEF